MSTPKLSNEEILKRLQIPPGKIRLVMDTDAKNEIDDQFAISWALRSTDRFNVEAVYAAPFSHDCMKTFFSGKHQKEVNSSGISYTEEPLSGMEQSYNEIIKLYEMLDIPHTGKVFRGADGYLQNHFTPRKSEATTDLIHRAMSGNDLLYVAAFGTITNIASAIIIEPEIINKIVVIWLGGQPLYFNHGIEFNLMQDVIAAQIIFNSGVPLVYIPCMNVASLLSVSEDEVKTKLLGKNKISNYLGNSVLETFSDVRTIDFMSKMLRHSYLKDREDQNEEYLSQFKSEHISWSRIIWDIATIAFLKNPTWTPSSLTTSPILQDDMTWAKTDETRHNIRVVNYCHRDLIFGDLFHCLTNNMGENDYEK